MLVLKIVFGSMVRLKKIEILMENIFSMMKLIQIIFITFSKNLINSLKMMKNYYHILVIFQ